MTTITRARTALQNLHQEHLMNRMHMGDDDYATVTNAMFRLLDRMEGENDQDEN